MSGGRSGGRGVSRGRTVRKMEGSREGCLIQGTAAKAVECKRIVPQNFPDFAAAQTSNLLHILLWPDKVFKMGVKKKAHFICCRLFEFVQSSDSTAVWLQWTEFHTKMNICGRGSPEGLFPVTATPHLPSQPFLYPHAVRVDALTVRLAL